MDTQINKSIEDAVVQFLQQIIEKMGYAAEIVVIYREPNLRIRIDSPSQNILIGRNGRNIDALQLLANIVAGRIDNDTPRIVLDSGDYREHQEKMLVKLANEVGVQVLRSGYSELLEPMNSFERSVVHRALHDVEQIVTRSEGEGPYKQVRISCSDQDADDDID